MFKLVMLLCDLYLSASASGVTDAYFISTNFNYINKNTIPSLDVVLTLQHNAK